MKCLVQTVDSISHILVIYQIQILWNKWTQIIPNSLLHNQEQQPGQCLWSAGSPSGYLQTTLFLELQLFHWNRKWPSSSGGADGWSYRTTHISPRQDASSQCHFLQQIKFTKILTLITYHSFYLIFEFLSPKFWTVQDCTHSITPAHTSFNPIISF